MKTFQKIKQAVLITIQQRLVYVKAVYVGIVSTTLQIIVLYYLWRVIYSANNTLNGISWSQMNSYLILSQAISIQFSMGVDIKISDDIYSGNIIFDFLKPLRYMQYLLGIKLGEVMSTIILRWLPIFLISSLFLGFGLPASSMHFLLFIVSFVISCLLVFFVEFMVGMISFYTLNKYGVRTIKQAVLALLSGALVPLSFLPDWIQAIVNVLPFRYMVSVPANLYIGAITIQDAMQVICVEIIWLGALLIFATLSYQLVARRITVHGG